MTDYAWHLPDPDTQPEFYADVPLKRLLAWGIDAIITLVAALLLLPFTGFLGIIVFLPMLLVVGFFYRIATITRGSATWGMRVMSIEFRTNDGARFDGQMALAHTGLFTVCCAMFPAQLFSMVLIATTPRARSLPDHVLGSVVLNRRAGG